MKIRTVIDVAQAQLCTGCGVCAYINSKDISMVDVLDHGRRPQFLSEHQDESRNAEALRACPGIGLEHDPGSAHEEAIPELLPAWGPVLELWEGYATDEQLRHAGSSGGAASALALYGIEQASMRGVLHINARSDVPYLNETILSTTRDQLLSATGSRYAPASPCDGLEKIEQADGPCVFIGKPCDVAGAKKAAALRPALAENLGLTIAIFCAGTPSTAGTLEMLAEMGISDPSTIQSVRYRGNGWPGRATARAVSSGGEETVADLSYQESWGDILEKHRAWRCHICADHSGEFADIAVGDPWYRPVPEGCHGYSLVVARTKRGQRFVQAAVEAGYLELEGRSPEHLERSQVGFPINRGKIWGRLLALRLAGIPAPVYRGMPMLRFWWRLGWNEKLRSFLGTWKRIPLRKLRRRATLVPFEPELAVRTRRSSTSSNSPTSISPGDQETAPSANERGS